MRKLLTIAALLLSMSAAAQKELKIYAYGLLTDDEGLVNIWAKEFEKRCDCKITLIASNASSSQLIQRIRMDPKGGDIVMGIEADYIEQARDLVTHHKISTPDYPFDWQDPEFLAFDYGWLSFIGKNGETLPSSFAQLLENPEIKIILENPRTSGFGYWLHGIYGDQTKEKWKRLQKNIRTITPSWSDAYSLFLKDEGNLVMSYITSPAYHKEFENSEDYIAAIFDEGHYLQIETMALLKTSKNPELARDFFRYVLSKDAQKEVALRNFMLPVADVKLPQSFQWLKLPEKSIKKQPSDPKILEIFR